MSNAKTIAVTETHHTDPNVLLTFSVMHGEKVIVLWPMQTKHGALWSAAGGPGIEGPLTWKTEPETIVLVELGVSP